MTPSRDDGVTVLGTTQPTRCSMCGVSFEARGRQLWCSARCRQSAFRRRSQSPLTQTTILRPVGGRRAATVYECSECQARTLGTQRCADCNRFAVRVGLGGLCPFCEEPVALVDLAPELAPRLEGKA